jgi:hypothetical protein
MNIQRFTAEDYYVRPAPTVGEYVLYADHELHRLRAYESGCKVGYEQGVKEATDRLWRHLTTKYAPITGKGMTNGPVCVDEAVAITGGETL